MAWPDGLPGQEERPRSDCAWARAEHRQGFVLNHHSFTKGQGLLCAGAALPPSPAGSTAVRAVSPELSWGMCCLQAASHSPGQASTPLLACAGHHGQAPLPLPLAASPSHGLRNPTRASLAGEWELLDLWCRVVAIIVCVKDPPVWPLPKEDPEKKIEEIWGVCGHSCSFKSVLGDGRSTTSGPGHPDRHSTQLMAWF